MDKKEEQLILFYYSRIKSGIFDEKDVYSFLILIRESAEKTSPIREFGDFIAHREKDRGFIKDYLLETKNILDNLGRQNAILKIKPVFSFDAIKESFGKVLAKKGLDSFSSEVLEDIILCIISLLQNIDIYDKNKNHIGNLIFAIEKDEIMLLGKIQFKNKIGATFPVLTIINKYEEIPKKDVPTLFTRIVEIINVNGKMRIIPTEFESGLK